MKKAAGYLRVSTDNQVGDDKFGLIDQRQSIEAFAASQGFCVVVWYSDAGISGATLDRPELQALLSEAKDRTFEAVIVAKMDRVARDLMAQLWIEKELLKYEVELISAAEPFRGQDPANVLFRQIIGAFAQFEKSRIAERLAGGRKQKAKIGGYAGGKAAIGYRAERGSKRIEVDEEKAATVIRVFQLRASFPNWTLQQIADQLNSEGHTTAQDKMFHRKQVSRILKRESLYAGRYCYAGIEAEGEHESIL